MLNAKITLLTDARVPSTVTVICSGRTSLGQTISYWKSPFSSVDFAFLKTLPAPENVSGDSG